MEFIPLAVAAHEVGLSRHSVYRIAVSEQRIAARKVVSRERGGLRARWMVELAELQNYLGQSRIVEETFPGKDTGRTQQSPAVT